MQVVEQAALKQVLCKNIRNLVVVNF